MDLRSAHDEHGYFSFHYIAGDFYIRIGLVVALFQYKDCVFELRSTYPAPGMAGLMERIILGAGAVRIVPFHNIYFLYGLI